MERTLFRGCVHLRDSGFFCFFCFDICVSGGGHIVLHSWLPHFSRSPWGARAIVFVCSLIRIPHPSSLLSLNPIPSACLLHSPTALHSLLLSLPPSAPLCLSSPPRFALTIELVVVVLIGTDGQVEACRLSPGDHAATVALAAMSMMFGLFTCCMACDQCQVASTNQTKIDRCGQRKSECFWGY